MSNLNKVLGIERINERTQRPNKLINFIKPLPGPSQHLAQDFLSRIAAIVYPVMRTHNLVVMSLEEYAPNPEFVGRNFNAGEVIQLVLRAPGSGQWLPFRHVQMVMMHELAHCKEMNHSKAFWGVRDAFAEELRGLWGRGYSGEGLWGKGRDLLTGKYMTERMLAEVEDGPSICGGTFRRTRGRKRRRGGEEKPKVSYAERQQRRIAKKFGVQGQALGGDDYDRFQLEKKYRPSKPRVAQSKRGRELRAAAALARFDTNKAEVKEEEEMSVKDESDLEDDDAYETNTDDEDYETTGETLGGDNMIKTCGDEDPNDDDVQREREELRHIDGSAADSGSAGEKSTQSANKDKVSIKTEPGTSILDLDDVPADSGSHSDAALKIKREDDEEEATSASTPRPISRTSHRTQSRPNTQVDKKTNNTIPAPPQQLQPPTPSTSTSTSTTASTCPICTITNPPSAASCTTCAHVLNPRMIPNAWTCGNRDCNSAYRNLGDYGRCGLCGAVKPDGVRGLGDKEDNRERRGGDQGVRLLRGVSDGDVLRWD